MKKRKLYIICLKCEKLAGEADSLIGAAAIHTCPKCGGETTVKTRRPGKQKIHHGGLPRRKYLDPEELQGLRDWLQARTIQRNSYRAWTDYITLEILACSGLRAGELVSTPEHPQRYLRLCDLALDDKEPELEVTDGKGHVSRTVPISTALAEKLQAYIEKWRADAPTDGPLLEREDSANYPMSYSILVGKVRTLGRDYQLKDSQGNPRPLHPHMLRHSYAVRYLRESGNNLQQLKELLGHANIATTLVYAATVDVDRRRNAEKMS